MKEEYNAEKLVDGIIGIYKKVMKKAEGKKAHGSGFNGSRLGKDRFKIFPRHSVPGIIPLMLRASFHLRLASVIKGLSN